MRSPFWSESEERTLPSWEFPSAQRFAGDSGSSEENGGPGGEVLGGAAEEIQHPGWPVVGGTPRVPEAGVP